ncbi:hypothetical protein GDO86_003504 [Hymenochirus boettgeri]|uniref:Platelet-activating factor acetylhydrolase n=1 Tax=Hymenochirus boettgeri TaxID=247094 RepID=A0A8T2K4D3_9PIPI|nr:hypothetical protein GDO86_003504 [Hymenochirus boettgeri]
MGAKLSLTIPSVTGPHPVSCTDIMTGYGKESIFFRLFYPCGPSPVVHQTLWIPRTEYVTALAKLKWESNINQYISSFILGQAQVPIPWNIPLESGIDKKPLIIFSHGLGAFRSMYSALCMELASNGFLVAVLEHRDGSACATYHFTDPAQTDTPLQEVWVPFRKVEVGTKEFYLRNYQLHHRANECVRAMRILKDINNGVAIHNVLKSEFDLQAFKDRIDFSKVAVMGHSFGGASAILCLAKDDTFRCAVALDAWISPLDDTSYPYIHKPILFINAEDFQTDSSIQKMKRLNSGKAEIITLVGTVHMSLSDFAFLSGFLIEFLSPRGTMDPVQCLKATIHSSLTFLQKHLGLSRDFCNLDQLSDETRACIVPDFPLINSSKL